MELIFVVMFELLIAIVVALVIGSSVDSEKTEVEVEKKTISYIEADEDEKISREIDRFVKENNCYIPKK